MKEFLKIVLATVVGLVITGVVFTILGIISLAGIMAASSGTETVVPKDAVFVLELKGTIVERYESSPLDKFMDNKTTTYGLDDILSSIRKAKENENIKGIYLNAESFSCAPASLQAIRRQLLDFKKSGKFLIAYGGNYSQGGYYLASAADKVMLNPKGTIGWHGLAGQVMFFKDLLAKVGVDMQVFRVGTYKSAVEPFIATEMSEANREQTQAYIQSIWNGMVDEVSASRKLSKDSLNALADHYMDLQEAEACLQSGMADMLVYKDSVLSYLKQKAGIEPDDKLPTLSLEEMINVKRNVPKNKSGQAVAVYYASGTIDGGGISYNGDGISSEAMMKDLRKLREDDDVKAVVLRVNSPGGSAYGSEQIWREVSLLKAKKPVVVSMGDYAASGGYYISCAADWIMAEPATLTGSIGIFAYIPDPSKLLNDKLGIHIDGVKTNKLSDLGTLGRPFNSEESALLQNMINNGYELFTQRCAEGRKMPIDEIKKVAEGRVWTGKMAKDIKLVDQLGGLDDAIRAAAKRAQLKEKEYSVLAYPDKTNFWSSLMNNMSPERYIQSRLNETLGEYYSGIQFIKHIEKEDRLQARMPFILRID